MEKPSRPSWEKTVFYYSLVIFLGCITVLLLSQVRRAKAVPDQMYQSLDVFIEVLEKVRDNYVTEVESEQLIGGAIQGLFNACDVDEDTAFLTPEVYDAVFGKQELADAGLVIHLTDCQPYIAQVIPGSPAAAEDMRPGDALVEINDTDTRGRSRYDLLAALRGPVGSEVILKTYRKGWKDLKEITLSLQLVAVPALGQVKKVEEGIGYLKIIQLGDNVFNTLSQALKGLENGQLEGLVLDLRDTPGGNIEQTARVADLFLKQGLIAKIREYKGKQARQWQAGADKMDLDMPLAVLINNGTKQEAEVLAAALAYHDRAVLVGSTTHGNASVEENISKKAEGVMRISVTLYELPDGTTFQGEGISPDLVVAPVEDVEDQESDTDPALNQAVETLKDPEVYSRLIAGK